MVTNPWIIVADEPTGNLDFQSGEELMGLLQQLNSKGKTIIMVTHDLEYMAFASRSLIMFDGKIVGQANQQELAGKINGFKKLIASVTQATPKTWQLYEKYSTVPRHSPLKLLLYPVIEIILFLGLTTLYSLTLFIQRLGGRWQKTRQVATACGNWVKSLDRFDGSGVSPLYLIEISSRIWQPKNSYLYHHRR